MVGTGLKINESLHSDESQLDTDLLQMIKDISNSIREATLPTINIGDRSFRVSKRKYAYLSEVINATQLQNPKILKEALKKEIAFFGEMVEALDLEFGKVI